MTEFTSVCVFVGFSGGFKGTIMESEHNITSKQNELEGCATYHLLLKTLILSSWGYIWIKTDKMEDSQKVKKIWKIFQNNYWSYNDLHGLFRSGIIYLMC